MGSGGGARERHYGSRAGGKSLGAVVYSSWSFSVPKFFVKSYVERFGLCCLHI